MWFESIVRTIPEPLTDGLRVPMPSLAFGSRTTAPSELPPPYLAFWDPTHQHQGCLQPQYLLPTLCPHLPLCLHPYPATRPYPHLLNQPACPLATPHFRFPYGPHPSGTLHSGDAECHLKSRFPGPAPFKCLSQPSCVTIKRVPVDLN